MKFTKEELLNAGSCKFKFEDLSAELQKNVTVMVIRLNWLGKFYSKPVKATSFLRSLEAQKKINPKALNSCHLYGRAVDISDPKGEFKLWIMDNLDKIIEAGFWVEDFNSTPTWVHLQDCIVASGNRFFKP